jgi:hypothetical protein
MPRASRNGLSGKTIKGPCLAMASQLGGCKAQRNGEENDVSSSRVGSAINGRAKRKKKLDGEFVAVKKPVQDFPFKISRRGQIWCCCMGARAGISGHIIGRLSQFL